MTRVINNLPLTSKGIDSVTDGRLMKGLALLNDPCEPKWAIGVADDGKSYLLYGSTTRSRAYEDRAIMEYRSQWGSWKN
jgi:hypothetical protein